MPELVKFEDLFVPGTVSRDRDAFESRKIVTSSKTHKVQGWVINYASDRYDSFYAKPTEKLVDAVADRMLALTYDTIYFMAHDRGDYIEIYAHYNIILGSHSLFHVDKSTWVTRPVAA